MCVCVGGGGGGSKLVEVWRVKWLGMKPIYQHNFGRNR